MKVKKLHPWTIYFDGFITKFLLLPKKFLNLLPILKFFMPKHFDSIELVLITLSLLLDHVFCI